MLQYSAISKHFCRKQSNKGMDIIDPQSFADALTVGDGISNMMVMLGHVIQPSFEYKEADIKNFTDYNHITFEEEGIRVYRHSGIGPGELIHLNPIADIPRFEYKVVTGSNGKSKKRKSFLSSMFKSTKSTQKVQPLKRTYGKFKQTGQSEETSLMEIDSPSDNPNEDVSAAVFKCEETQFCNEVFSSFEKLQNHQLFGVCSYRYKHQETMRSYIKRMYVGAFAASNTENLSSATRRKLITNFEPLIFVEPPDDLPKRSPAFSHKFHQGFALKTRKAAVTYQAKHWEYLLRLFMLGEDSPALKKRPDDVVESMKLARAFDGTLLFEEDEWLKASQIRSVYIFDISDFI